MTDRERAAELADDIGTNPWWIAYVSDNGMRDLLIRALRTYAAPPVITDEMVDRARMKGRELAGGSVPGALRRAMEDVAEAGLRAAIEAA